MYLSHLLINVGDNPDRPRPGRLWLRNVYHVHQRLCMAFPTPVQSANDPEFIRSFDPAGFDAGRFLFRIDNAIHRGDPRVVVLVLSTSRPDWGYAFQNARMFLAAEPETREFIPTFTAGSEFRFRIRVNLSKKSKKSGNGTDLRKLRDATDSKGRQKEQNKRVALTWNEDQRPEEVIVPWFAGKGAHNGFEVRQCEVLQIGWVNAWPSTKKAMKFRSGLLEGRLVVTDAGLFGKAIASGIGSAKAFGFGLLSVARG